MHTRSISKRWSWGTAAALSLLVGQAFAVSAVREFAWANSSAGPDGPWNVIVENVDFPAQTVRFFPSLTSTTMFLNATNCAANSDQCPNPVIRMWDGSAAQYTLRAFNSSVFALTSQSWDRLVDIVGLKGTGHYMLDRIQFCDNCFLDGNAILSGDDIVVTYPGGASYRPDVGYLSMNGSTDNVSWDNTTGTEVTGNKTLSNAFLQGLIPSKSYGLHVGSVYPQINGSLVWGGYDASRLIGPPLISNNETFTVRDITLTVSSGGGAYLNNTSNSSVSVLTGNAPSTVLSARPDPGVPYLYLPKGVCDAIATHIPVTYSKDFDLYTWDTSSSAYTAILNSPHSLTFSFDSAVGASGVSTINVPFKLLNLTLDYPLASPPVQYFPCRPYTPSSGTPYILGRAFLQAAFLGHIWGGKKQFLAQAPGPSLQAASITGIAPRSVALSGYQTTPSWEQTWALTLAALPGTFNNTLPTPATSGGSSSSGKSSGLSGGAIAGIAIGVVIPVLAALAAAFYIWRKRKGRNAGDATEEPLPAPYSDRPPAELSGVGNERVEKSALSDHEMANVGGQPPSEGKYVHTANNEPPAELDASTPVRD